MSIEAIQALSATQTNGIQETQLLDTAQAMSQPAPVQANGAFGNIVSQGLEAVNRDLMVTQRDMQELATGNVQNLHQIMIRLEESRLSFQLLMQVRNRLLEGYQDIMKMQI